MSTTSHVSASKRKRKVNQKYVLKYPRTISYIKAPTLKEMTTPASYSLDTCSTDESFA